ncbi:MAG: hypothetical protein IJA14_02945 [Alphaproteobacteria bacterium]|nr:hypothetical protein [Alphaproteobacteria bacterium]
MPVLILLIYYMHDLFLLQRYHSQTEFVAYQAIQMIQSISQNRSDKKITLTDLRNIYTSVFLSVYPTNNFSSIAGAHKNNHWGELFLYYVRGNSDGTASVIWSLQINLFNNNEVRNTPSLVRAQAREASNGRSRIPIVQNVSPKTIYSKLNIGKNDIRMILEACLDYSTAGGYNLSNGSPNSTIPYDKVYGFHLLKPKYGGRVSGEFTCFNSIVVFSPNPNLFTETAPQ